MLRVYDMERVKKNVEQYLQKHLPQYKLLEVRKKSVYPEDSYLFMVSAKNENDGTYAVFASWNETTQSLNHGHYDLRSIEECEKVFTEYYNDGRW